MKGKISFNLKNLTKLSMLLVGYDDNDGKKKTLIQFALGSLKFLIDQLAFTVTDLLFLDHAKGLEPESTGLSLP